MSTTEDDASTTTQRKTRVGRFSYDTGADLWEWDHHVFRILGLEPWSVAPATDYMLSCVDPAVRARVCDGLLRAQDEGEAFGVSYLLSAADGVERRVLVVLDPAPPWTARPVAEITGHVVDLTDDFRQESADAARRAVIESGQHRAIIDQAVGTLMVAYGLTAEQAFEMLRSWSQNRNVKVRHLAARLVEAASRGTASRPDIRTLFDALLHDISAAPPSRAPDAPTG